MLRTALEPRLKAAKGDAVSKDSPLFQLLQNFKGVNLPDSAEGSFHERALKVQKLREQQDAIVPPRGPTTGVTG